MPNPFFSARIPSDLHEHIEAFRQTSGESKTELLIRALAQYTGYQLQEISTLPLESPLIQRIEALEDRVTALESKPAVIRDSTSVITSDNSDNIRESEMVMARKLGLTRSKLRIAREHLEAGHAPETCTLTGTIDDQTYRATYVGKENRSHIWEATPD